jgi:cytochrome P450
LCRKVALWLLVTSLKVSLSIADRRYCPLTSTLAGGTTVSVPLVSLHHNADVFPKPYEFIPERWLEEDTQNLRDFCTPFSIGPRACIGRNIVYFESLIIIATLVHRYDFELPSPDWTMKAKERLNINPASLWVSIKRREMVV